MSTFINIPILSALCTEIHVHFFAFDSSISPFRMLTSFDLLHAVLSNIPWVLTDPSDISWYNQFTSDVSLQNRLFNDDYWDLLVVSYDRFYRAISLCPKSRRRNRAIRNTARRLYYGHLIGRTALLTAPPRVSFLNTSFVSSL